VIQQLLEAFPEAGPYQYAIFDRDSAFNEEVVTFLGPKRAVLRIGARMPLLSSWGYASLGIHHPPEI